MSFSDIRLLKKLGLGMLSFTGALTVLFGGWIFISAVSKPPEILALSSPDRGTVARSPSSVSGMEPDSVKIEKTDSKMETLTLGCLKDGSVVEIQSAAKRVRVSGRLCQGKIASLNESSIVNRTNGFAATLFDLKNGGFSSDYIALAEGTNALWLEIEDMKGARAVANVNVVHAPEP